MSHCSFHDEIFLFFSSFIIFLLNFILFYLRVVLQGQMQRDWEMNEIEMHDVKVTKNKEIVKHFFLVSWVVVVCAFNPSTWKAEADRSLSSRPAWCTGASSRAGYKLYRKTLSEKTKKKKTLMNCN